MKKTPNPVIKLLFQVCFSPHKRAALAILWLKPTSQWTHLAPRPRSPGNGHTWISRTQNWRQEADGHMHTLDHSWNPWFWLHPLSQPHHILPAGGMAQEPQSDVGQVPLLSPVQFLCWWRCTVQNYQTGEFCPQCFYRAQHKAHPAILFSLEFSSPSIAVMES